MWGRMDTCLNIWMAESLCCPPETQKTLLIGYTPIQNKKFIKKKWIFVNSHGIFSSGLINCGVLFFFFGGWVSLVA